MQQQSQGHRPFEEFRTMVGFAFHVMRAFSITVEVLLRHRFGDRYLRSTTILGGFLVLVLFNTPTLFTPPHEVTQHRSFLGAYLWIYLGLCLFHRLTLLEHQAKDQHWHSWGDGQSWPVWGRLLETPELVQAVIEPLLCLAAGVVAARVDPRFGMFLSWAALSLFVKELLFLRRRAERLQDVVDSAIEAEVITEELEPTPAMPSAACTTRDIRDSGAASKAMQATLADAFASLPPGLSELLEPEQPDSRHRTDRRA